MRKNVSFLVPVKLSFHRDRLVQINGVPGHENSLLFRQGLFREGLLGQLLLLVR
jgi:hypothetical protein